MGNYTFTDTTGLPDKNMPPRTVPSVAEDDNPAPLVQRAEKSPIDRDSPLPIYVQIKRRLLAEIHAWSHADRPFTPEHELSARFGVARATMRQAMSELVNEGYLVRRRGLGTFVMTEKVVERIDMSMNFIEQWASLGRKMTFELLRVEKTLCPCAWQGRMKLDGNAEVWQVVRLRRAERVPVSIDYRMINARFADTLRKRDLERHSILDLLNPGARPITAEFGLECREADVGDAEYLNLVPGDLVLTRHMTYLTGNEEVAMAGTSLYRPDQARWSVRVPLEEGAPRADRDG
ncbi:GntR family transcriptional regulator (plasmid) [Paraburkholderia sp. PREW-6R]|uniref:GntR family transcriptional regulator n=1 Tax=Paraburkholderia sp. PREW-6R TaxID=3141544 RepID=UPI0031F56C1B